LRVPHDGERHVKPHPIQPHLRRRPITEEHRQHLEEFEQQYGVSILKRLPEGYTFVRPGFSPPGSGEFFWQMPEFIRTRVQQAMEVAVDDAVAKMTNPLPTAVG
jgi:hypothetical protein